MGLPTCSNCSNSNPVVDIRELKFKTDVPEWMGVKQRVIWKTIQICWCGNCGTTLDVSSVFDRLTQDTKLVKWARERHSH